MSSYDNKKSLLTKKNLSKLLLTMLLSTSLISMGINYKELFDNNIYDEDDNLVIDEDEYNKMLDELSIILDKDLTEDDLNYLLLYSVFSNNNLSDIEKDKIYNLITMIEDNPYIDKDVAYRDLSNLKIIYTNRGFDTEEDVIGRYNCNKDIIEIYEDNSNEDVLYHELIHCVYSNENTMNLPSFLVEGTTEILEKEYFSKDIYLEEDCYIYEVVLVKILCELTSPDCVLKAYSTGDINCISNEICKYSDFDLNEINKMLYSMDNLFKDNDKKFFDFEYSNTITFINSIYNNKKKDDNFDKINCKYLIDLFSNMSTSLRVFDYFNYLEKNGVSTKIYFNSSIKEDDYTYVDYKFNLDENEYKAYSK